MKTEEYIRSEITRHLDIHKISYREAQITEMAQLVLVGTSAFQIIFNQVFDPFCEDGDEIYLLEKWKSLDRSLIKEMFTTFGKGTVYHQLMYSYDGGKRYQWTERETILIDLRILRDIKINELGI
jgi:hypothetical protein